MISVEFNKDSDAVVLFVDAAGVDELIKILLEVRGKPDDHIHLMTSAAGSRKLRGVPHGSNSLFENLIVYSTDE